MNIRKIAGCTFAIAAVTGSFALTAHAEPLSGAGQFKWLVDPNGVFNEKAKLWKPVPTRDQSNLTHDDESYVVIAKRSDGSVVMLDRQPDYSNPHELTYVGYEFKCGQMTSGTFFVPQQTLDVLTKELASPAIDESPEEIDKTTGMYDYYSLVCAN
jgi:hypothetical protein